MTTLEAAALAAEELTALAGLAHDLPNDSQLREFLDNVVAAVRDGSDVTAVVNEKMMTPATAAKLLGVSRVHVYKLMDRGELPFVRVGNDRRTTMAEVMQFLEAQDNHRREMANRAAHPHLARQAALEGLLSE